MKTISSILILFLTILTCPAGVDLGSGINRGIVVHLNCGDGKGTVELAEGNPSMFHGLDKSADHVGKARRYIQSKNLYGRVSVAKYDGRKLPYGNNLINLIVADSLGDVSMDEVMRVLVPKGTAIIGGKQTVKPWPQEIDDWPQYLNKADNNAVAMDTVAGPPRRIQWLDEPLWSRSHMGIATIASVVTCSGRMFSIEDRALPDNPFLPGRFMYIARDAFNGQTLWTRKITRWESIETYIKCIPTQQQRRMVATDDILFCTPVLEGPLAALDAATGKTLKTYEGIAPVQEVAYDQGILFVNVGERFNADAYNQTSKKAEKGVEGTPGETFAGAGFRKGYAPRILDKENPVSSIVAIDPTTGKQLWKTGKLNNYTGASLAVKGNHAVYQTSEGMFCVDPKTGKQLWSVKKAISNTKAGDSNTPGTQPNTLIITDDIAFAVEGGEMYGYSLKDGKFLWQTKAMGNYRASVDLFYVNDILWTGVGSKGGAKGIDPKTGEIVKRISQQVTGPMGHDRCYRNFITKKFYINSKTGGADFLNLENGSEYPNHWTRGTCGFGVLPANGLVYSTPYSCTCNVGVMMKGVNAYCADPELLESNDSGRIKRLVRLEKGPAYGKTTGKAAAPGDWPTYRGNAFRGGITKAAVSPKLNVKWKVKLPGNPTASTVVGNRLYVCTPETHTLYALDSSSGKTAWRFTADARIDSPPTYHNGMLLFGSNDGWIYCVRAADGVLAWRFRDLPDRLVGAFGQFESAWPIPGSVLVLDGEVYAAAGRNSYLDGGMFIYCLDAATGKLLNRRSSFGPFAKETGFPVGFKNTKLTDTVKARGKSKRRGEKAGKVKSRPSTADYIPGFLNDVPASDGKDVFIRHAAFNKDLQDLRESGSRLMTLGGFLDRRVQHRTGFVFSNYFEWWKNNPKDIMISDGQETYGIAGFQSSHNHAYFDPRTSSYKLSGNGLEVKLPINGRGLAKAGDVIFATGQPMKFKESTWLNYENAYTGKLGGKLMAISAKDGQVLSTVDLEADPVWDSIALAGGKLYISLEDGTIQCMGK